VQGDQHVVPLRKRDNVSALCKAISPGNI